MKRVDDQPPDRKNRTRNSFGSRNLLARALANYGSYGGKGKFRFIHLLFFALSACLAAVALEERIITGEDIFLNEKKAAVALMVEACNVIKGKRLSLGLGIDPGTDPNETGLIGPEYTDLTTTLGSLPAKRTSTQPLFAGVIVDMLGRADVRAGDKVAVCFSGSFPALNIGVLSAIKVLDATPVITSSVGASMFGANDPGMTWLDMERILGEAGLMDFRSVAASLGGIIGCEGGLGGTGIEKGMAAIRGNGIHYLDEGKQGALEADIVNRLRSYERALNGERPSAFVNVGGASVALGSCRQALHLDTGLMARIPISVSPERGLIFRMAERGVPVIHLLNIRQLASRYGLPFDPFPLSSEQEQLYITERLRGRLLETMIVLAAIILFCLAVEAVDMMRRKFAVTQ